MGGMTTVERHIEEHVCLCKKCGGAGSVGDCMCPQCHGSGRVWLASDVKTYMRPFREGDTMVVKR